MHRFRITDAAKLYLSQFEGRFVIFVGIHVRRNDFKTQLQKKNRKFLGADYFQRAVEEITTIVLGLYTEPHNVRNAPTV